MRNETLRTEKKMYQEALIKTEDGWGRELEAMRETIRETNLRVHS